MPQSFPTECDGTITAEEAITVGDTDFSGVLGNIAADAPEFLYFPIFVAEGALITQQARETAGLEDTILAGADGILTPDWLSAAGDAAEGVVLSGPDLAFSGDFYADEFLPAYTEVSGEDAPISVFHAHAFDAYNMLADCDRSGRVRGWWDDLHPANRVEGCLLRDLGLRGRHRHADLRRERRLRRREDQRQRGPGRRVRPHLAGGVAATLRTGP